MSAVDVAAQPERRRPLSTVLGSLLMLARAVAGFVFVAVSASELTDVVLSIVREILDSGESQRVAKDASAFVSTVLVIVLVAYLIWHTMYFFLMVAVFRGSDKARIVALSFATGSIIFAVIATVSGGEEISFHTSLLSLALDVLILLALSGQDSRVFARWDRVESPRARRRRERREARRAPAPVESAVARASDAEADEPAHPEDAEFPRL